MKPTPLMIAALVSQLLPALAALFARDRLTPPRRWLVVWCLLYFVQDVVNAALALRGMHNLWTAYVGAPLTGSVALWMLSLWQDTRTSRLALQIAIPIFVVVSVVLSITVDDPTTFSKVAAPFHHLVLLFAALWTFVRRSLGQRESLASSGWFWILAGFMVYSGMMIAIQAVVWYLYEAGRADVLRSVFDFQGVVHVIAFSAMAGGMLCPVPPKPSGWRFSPQV